MILNHIFERDLSRFCLLVTQKIIVRLQRTVITL